MLKLCALLCALPVLLAAAEAVVPFTALSKTRLPYNQRIAIEGSTADFKDATSFLVIRSVGVAYSACKTGNVNGEVPASEVAGDKWTVLAGPFEEGEKVCFIFKINGTLTPKAAEAAADKLLQSSVMRQELETFFERVEGKDADVVDALARRLVDTLTPQIVAA